MPCVKVQGSNCNEKERKKKMYSFPIGVLLESFRTDIKTALDLAVSVGVSGIQVLATAGELDAETITVEKRKEFLSMVKDHNLTISALCGDFICCNPNYNFYESSKSQKVIDRSKRILDLAKEMGTDIVTTHVGVIPSNKNCEKYERMLNTCSQLASYAESMNAYFAIETGPEMAVTLKSFLDDLGSKGIGVNLDPANFVMVTGDDPAKAVYTLKDYIVHTHAKDGKRLLEANPEVIYQEIETQIQSAKYFEEVPLGEGSVDFDAYLKALEEIGYRGYLTIEREVGEEPAKDIQKAVDFLKNKINK